MANDMNNKSTSNYDSSLDEVTYKSPVLWEDNYSSTSISVFKYNDGVQKVQVLKWDKKTNTTKASFGRWTQEQVQILIRALAVTNIKMSEEDLAPNILNDSFGKSFPEGDDIGL